MKYIGKLGLLTICITLLYTALFFAIYGNEVPITDRYVELFAFSALITAILVNFIWTRLASTWSSSRAKNGAEETAGWFSSGKDEE